MNRRATDSPFIIRAPKLRATNDARAIVAEAQKQAERMIAEAQAESERIAADAENKAETILAEARSRGRAEAAAKAATLMAQTAESLDRFWHERNDELLTVALAVAHRVLSVLPPEDILLGLATGAIAEHGRDTRLALKTSPEMAEGLRSALSGLDFGDRVTVSPDPMLEPGGCTLLYPQGRTEIGLVSQFKAMLAGTGGRR